MLGLSYWVFPVISGFVWIGTLLGLLLHWIVDTNEKKYGSMGPKQNIAYISDIGAQELKPLFVAGSCVTTVFLDLAFISERWLRHRGRLVPNGSVLEKVLSVSSIFFAIAGTAGLILLSIFDTATYPRLHDGFLLLFIVGYILSAVCICWEYQRLGHKFREHGVLRLSFWVKLMFIIIEACLAISFAACTFNGVKNAGAILEWVIAFIFSFYVFSFIIDLYPAVHTRKHAMRYTKTGALMEKNSMRRVEEGEGSDGNLAPGNSTQTYRGTHF